MNDENIFLSITANFYRGTDFSRIIETWFFCNPCDLSTAIPSYKTTGKVSVFWEKIGILLIFSIKINRIFVR